MNFQRDKFEEALKAYQTPVDLNLVAKRILPLIDLTRLNEDDHLGDISLLCRSARAEYGHVAGVCIYLPFVTYAKSELAGTKIKMVTVVNFPTGDEPLDKVLLNIQKALLDGTDEIDVVFPYKTYLNGDELFAKKYIQKCKEACGKQIFLKVILETGAFPDHEKIYQASQLVIEAKADFLKTSTGKVAIGATPEAATAMLLAIKDSGEKVGFKVSGGVRDIPQAAGYLSIADFMMGDQWVSPETFRIGASSLLDEVLKELAR